MGIVIFLLIVGSIVYFLYFLLSRDSQEVRDLCKGRTPDQKKTIRYFKSGGLFRKTISDSQYDAMVQDYVNKIDFKQKALSKIGLDESELQEIKPISFEGYLFDNKKTLAKWGKSDRVWRSSAYQITWIFFSNTQVYVYQYTFNMDEDGKKEQTLDYFYKDVTNITASSDTVEKEILDKVSCSGNTTYIRKNVDTHHFTLVVPGDKFWAVMKQTDENERAIQGMKTKLREKKNA